MYLLTELPSGCTYESYRSVSFFWWGLHKVTRKVTINMIQLLIISIVSNVVPVIDCFSACMFNTSMIQLLIISIVSNVVSVIDCFSACITVQYKHDTITNH